MPPFPFPFLGDYVPHGWEKLEDELFVDKTGMGADYESALTVEQFKAECIRLYRENYPSGVAFAITQEGQFQLYVGVYRYVGKK